MNPPIPQRLGVDIKGGAPEVRMAGQILIGIELEAMRQAMGYQGEGSWQSHRGEDGRSTRPLWTEFCKTGAGVSDVTAGKLLRMAITVKRRLEQRPETMGFAALMDKPPSTLTAEALEELREVIAREVKGSTRKELIAAATRRPDELIPIETLRVLMRGAQLREAKLEQMAREGRSL